MAVINKPLDINDQDNKNTYGQGVNVSGTAAESAPTNAPSGTQQTPTSRGSSSGRFTNITNYLNANKNYGQQSGGLAGGIANKVQTQVGGLQQQIGQVPMAGGTAPSTTLVGQFQDKANQQRVQNYPDLINQLNNPTALASDPEKLALFNRMRTASYNGPTGLEGTEKIQQDLNKLGTVGNQVGTEAGRYNLLNTLYGRQGYTGGQQKLDQLLLQANPNQLNRLTGLNKDVRAVQNQFGTAQKYAQDTAQQIAQQNEQTKQNALQALAQAQNSAQQDLENKVKSTQASREDAYNNLVANLQQGKISKDNLEKFGINPNESLYNINPLDYVQRGQQATRYNVANPEDYARFGALAKLSGQDYSNYLPEQLRNQTNTLDNATGFNTSAFNQALQNAKGAYQSDFSKMMGPYGDLTQQPDIVVNPNDPYKGIAEAMKSVQEQQKQYAQAQGANKRFTVY